MPDKQQNLIARHTATLESFVLRARRIEAHSLASDKQALHKLSTMQFTVEFRPQEGKSYIVQELPPEEQVESAAARVRPLILQSEPTHYSKVIKALGYFVRDDPELSTAVKTIRKDWERIQPNGTNHLGSYTQIQNAEGEQSAFLSDTELAFAYIYGDVVHHDPTRLASTKMFGVKERFKAAAPIVAFMMVLSVATLNLTRKACKKELITLADSVFTEEVIVTETTFRNEAKVYAGPPGSPPPPGFSGASAFKD